MNLYMKNIFKSAVVMMAAVTLTSCYEDYVHDYESPNMGFALEKPLRTVVSSTNKIYVGVSIGGKREVDMNDWATFEIDESLLEGTGKTLMPENYYTLADPNTFRVRKKNLAVADVAITFTDDFYADPLCLQATYALPFRLTGTSIPGGEDQPNGAIREGGERSIVAIKYISGYSGTYYKLGREVEIDENGNETGSPVEYRDKDLSKNSTCAFATLGRDKVLRPGLGTSDDRGLTLTISEGAVTVEGEGVSDARGKYVREGDYTFHTGDGKAPQFELEYTYTRNGKSFKVTETLVLRQWPEAELRVETF